VYSFTHTVAARTARDLVRQRDGVRERVHARIDRASEARVDIASADVTVKLGLIKLLTKRFDLCDELSVFGCHTALAPDLVRQRDGVRERVHARIDRASEARVDIGTAVANGGLRRT
jgi:hypothetical protein